MGLAPSRQLYRDPQQAGGSQLPFISRPPEDYTYSLSDINPADTVSPYVTPPYSSHLSQEELQADADRANAAVYEPEDQPPEGYLYYYEHRAVPLTREFFPSPYSALFEQLFAARQQQNPRYHFQLTETWSPGTLVDPATAFRSLQGLAAVSMLDELQTFRLKSGQPPVLNGFSEEEKRVAASLADLEKSDVPFGSREQLYDLLVRTTEMDVLYESNQGLRSAAVHLMELAEQERNMHTQTNDAGSERRIRPLPCAIVLLRTTIPAETHHAIYAAASSQRHHNGGAGGPGDGARANSSNGRNKRRIPQASAAWTDDLLQGIRVSHIEVITAVSLAESARLQSQRESTMRVAGESGVCRWMRVRTAEGTIPRPEMTSTGPPSGPPHSQVSPYSREPVSPYGGAVDLRVVGIFGYWTLEEILRRSLFSNAPITAAVPPLQCPPVAAPSASRVDLWQRGIPPEAAAPPADIDLPRQVSDNSINEIIGKATPHGVPSQSLVAVTFFERHVGDKEQCHTFFALCRYYAHGLRFCLENGSTAGPYHPGSSLSGETAKQHSLWDRFVAVYEQPLTPTRATTTTEGGTAGSRRSDLSSAFIIRFSNIPQLQMCRQIRLLQAELREIYPQPLSLEALQRAQRARNMAQTGIRKRGKQVGVGGAASASSTTQPSTTPPPASPLHGTDGGRGEPSAVMELNPAGSDPSSRRSQHLPLDPDALAPPTLTRQQRLDSVGMHCYIADGAVVLRFSHQASVRAMHQLSYCALHDTVEAMCVALTTASPIPMVYRGELRLAHPPRSVKLSSTGKDPMQLLHNLTPAPDTGKCNAASSADPVQPTALAVSFEEIYCNAQRYSREASSGYPAVCHHHLHTSAGSLAASPAGGASSAEGVDWQLDTTRALTTLSPSQIGCVRRTEVEVRRGNYIPIEVRQHQLNDTFTVSAEIEGITFQELADLTIGRFLLASDTSNAQRCLERIPSGGVSTPDSVFGWSPSVHYLKAMQSLQPQQQVRGSSPNEGNGAEDWLTSTCQEAALEAATTPMAENRRAAPCIRVQEPHRILRLGDLIRFVPSNTSVRPVTPSSTGPQSRLCCGSPASGATMTPSLSGTWVVDETTAAEDLILSWMRRVSSRARESRSHETKWVRYPSHVYTQVLDHALRMTVDFAHCFTEARAGPPTGMAGTPPVSALEVLLPQGGDGVPEKEADVDVASEAKKRTEGGGSKGSTPTSSFCQPQPQLEQPTQVEPESAKVASPPATGIALQLHSRVLENLADLRELATMMRYHRFRLWRFSLDGFIFFHGVTVRMPHITLAELLALEFEKVCATAPPLRRRVGSGGRQQSSVQERGRVHSSTSEFGCRSPPGSRGTPRPIRSMSMTSLAQQAVMVPKPRTCRAQVAPSQPPPPTVLFPMPVQGEGGHVGLPAVLHTVDDNIAFAMQPPSVLPFSEVMLTAAVAAGPYMYGDTHLGDGGGGHPAESYFLQPPPQQQQSFHQSPNSVGVPLQIPTGKSYTVGGCDNHMNTDAVLRGSPQSVIDRCGSQGGGFMWESAAPPFALAQGSEGFLDPSITPLASLSPPAYPQHKSHGGRGFRPRGARRDHPPPPAFGVHPGGGGGSARVPPPTHLRMCPAGGFASATTPTGRPVGQQGPRSPTVTATSGFGDGVVPLMWSRHTSTHSLSAWDATPAFLMAATPAAASSDNAEAGESDRGIVVTVRTRSGGNPWLLQSQHNSSAHPTSALATQRCASLTDDATHMGEDPTTYGYGYSGGIGSQTDTDFYDANDPSTDALFAGPGLLRRLPSEGLGLHQHNPYGDSLCNLPPSPTAASMHSQCTGGSRHYSHQNSSTNIHPHANHSSTNYQLQPGGSSSHVPYSCGAGGDHYETPSGPASGAGGDLTPRQDGDEAGRLPPTDGALDRKEADGEGYVKPGDARSRHLSEAATTGATDRSHPH